MSNTGDWETKVRLAEYGYLAGLTVSVGSVASGQHDPDRICDSSQTLGTRATLSRPLNLPHFLRQHCKLTTSTAQTQLMTGGERLGSRGDPGPAPMGRHALDPLLVSQTQ